MMYTNESAASNSLRDISVNLSLAQEVTDGVTDMRAQNFVPMGKVARRRRIVPTSESARARIVARSAQAQSFAHVQRYVRAAQNIARVQKYARTSAELCAYRSMRAQD